MLDPGFEAALHSGEVDRRARLVRFEHLGLQSGPAHELHELLVLLHPRAERVSHPDLADRARHVHEQLA